MQSSRLYNFLFASFFAGSGVFLSSSLTSCKDPVNSTNSASGDYKYTGFISTVKDGYNAISFGKIDVTLSIKNNESEKSKGSINFSLDGKPYTLSYTDNTGAMKGWSPTAALPATGVSFVGTGQSTGAVGSLSGKNESLGVGINVPGYGSTSVNYSKGVQSPILRSDNQTVEVYGGTFSIQGTIVLAGGTYVLVCSPGGRFHEIVYYDLSKEPVKRPSRYENPNANSGSCSKVNSEIILSNGTLGSRFKIASDGSIGLKESVFRSAGYKVLPGGVGLTTGTNITTTVSLKKL